MIDEVCSRTSFEHFPVLEKDVSEGLVMWVISCDEKHSIIQGGLQQSGVGGGGQVDLFYYMPEGQLPEG